MSVVTSSISRFVGPAQSLLSDHRGMVCARVYIDRCSLHCKYLRLY
jgi:hypothetical protein